MGVPGGERRIEAVAERAVELDGGVDDLVHHVGEEDLGDAVLLAQVHAVLGLVGDMHEHQAGDVEFAGAFGEHELDALAVFETLAEGGTLGDMFRGQIQRALGHGDIVHAVAQATVSKTVLAHGEAAALAAEQVFFRHDEVFDLHLGMTAAHFFIMGAMDGHGRDVADDLVAGVWQLDDEGRVLLVARRVRIGLGHDDGDIGGAGRAGEPFLAIQDIVALAVFYGCRLHAGGVGAGSLFGHRVADALFAIEQRLEIFLFLEVGAVGEQREHGRIIGALRIHREGAEMALAEFHLDQRIGEGAEAHAAMLGGDERQPEALCTGLLAQFGQHGLVGLTGSHFLFGGDAFILHPLTDAFADFFCIIRNGEIDSHWCFLPVLLGSS